MMLAGRLEGFAERVVEPNVEDIVMLRDAADRLRVLERERDAAYKFAGEIEAMEGELRNAFTLMCALDTWMWESAEMVHRRSAGVHTDPFDRCGSWFCREVRALHLRVEELVP
jgi:hypothetical protein